MRTKDKEKELLFYKYYKEGLNDSEIAIILGKTSKSIFQYRKRRKLQANKSHKVASEDLVKKYYNEKLNDKEIGHKMGLSDNTIYNVRVRLGLHSKYPSKNEEVLLSDLQKQILVGGLLGDSFLRKVNSSVKGKIEHSQKQKDYLLYKHKLFGDLVLPVYYKQRGNLYTNWFEFKANKALIPFYQSFYSNGKKSVNKEVYEFLTPQALAIWYMDDGFCSAYGCTICTDSFSGEVVEDLINFINTTYNIKGSLTKRNRIYFGSKEVDKFFNLIKPFVIPSMIYKIDRIPKTYRSRNGDKRGTSEQQIIPYQVNI